MEQILQQILIELKDIKSDVATLKSDVTTLKSDVNDLKEGQNKTNERLDRLEIKVDTISTKLDDIEAKNASRHTEINTNIINLSKDLTVVEAVTKENLYDIAKIKAVYRVS